MQIPENLTAFLHWVKERTESFWSVDTANTNNEFVCEKWLHGATWKGLTEDEINGVEKQYAVKFTPEHREFLKILHAIDKKEPLEYQSSSAENLETAVEYKPFFYNWLQDETAIREQFEWPLKTILQDVKGANKVWLKSWGALAADEHEIDKVVKNWFNKAPKLLPLTSHRFVVSASGLMYNPILSVWGSDTIVYGWNFRSYLLNELQDHLNIKVLVYDDEDEMCYPELLPEVQAIFNDDFTFNDDKVIPVWQELILFWTSGWAGFGLKFPGQDDIAVHAITKTYLPEDLKDGTKTFNNF